MARYGIAITWTIANSAQYVEVTQSGDDGAGNPSTGTEVMLATLDPGTAQYIDFLPNDSTFRHYRVRHTMPGWTPGTFSPYVRAKPQAIPQFGNERHYQEVF